MKFEKKFTTFFASGFYSGFFPKAPGTAGSFVFATILALFSLKYQINALYFFFFVLWLIIFSIWVSNKALDLNIFNSKDKDPKQIVIDEWAGLGVAMVGIPFSLDTIILGFLLFRFFDVFKPYPIKKFEKLPKGYGITIDDVVAGIYAGLGLRLCIFFFPEYFVF